MIERIALMAAVFVTTFALLYSVPRKPPIRLPERYNSSPIYIQPEIAHISRPNPGYLPYPEIISQLKQWNQEAPALTEVGTYGQTSRGNPLYWMRIGTLGKPRVLITAAIHGNEPLSTSTLMSFAGNLLDKYSKDGEATYLLDEREIYFIPVVSPDSYPTSRLVDGIDPNRNFSSPNPSPTIRCLKEFADKMGFKAAMSCHTWGRVFLTPYGDNYQLPPNSSDYKRIISEMCRLTEKEKLFFTTAEVYGVDFTAFGNKFNPINIPNHYYTIRACEMYATPFSGGEMDWFYRHGAFAIVMEMGTHQHIPSMPDTMREFNLTFEAVKHFIKEAPLTQVR